MLAISNRLRMQQKLGKVTLITIKFIFIQYNKEANSC